ncbi:MAG: PTS sugar transporter, partial [Desulfuromonadales bacterium]|nr:PTS sugar transporter [Desulfuromonadales bacterium]NIR34273.1 PTS sugar transporter [Desulfuromonadales bacterium]NIS42851.1 PTS sugar transporter [Desulfuromonadales bacterium]
AVQERIALCLERLEAHEGGAIIMTDMFGGTPSNLSMPFLDSGLVEVVTGVNLPMVLKFFSNRNSMAAGDLANMLRDYGHQSIRVVSDFLKK